MNFPLQHLNSRTVVIKVGDQLDHRNAAAFQSFCQMHIRSGVRNFVLDLGDTLVVDAFGISSVFFLHLHLAPMRGQVAFARLSLPVRTEVELSGTYGLFEYFPSVDDARRAMAA